MLQASCVSTLNGRSVWCRQTGLVAANVFKPAANMVALTDSVFQMFWTFFFCNNCFGSHHQPLILLKWVAVTFLFGRRLKIAEYSFKTDRRLNKEAKIHALGVLIIDRLFRSLWWNVPFISSLCTFYLQHTSAWLEPWPSWQNRTCAWWTIPVTMWVTYKRIQKRNKYALWTTKHKTWEITKQTRIQKLKQKHYICEINNPNNNMGSRTWECGYEVFAFDLFSFFVFL